MTAATYTIYIVNQSGTSQAFWCFQAQAMEFANDPENFANSGALLAVPLNDQRNADFAVAAQDDVEAGDEETGLKAETVSDVTDDASLPQLFKVSYLAIQLPEQSSGSSPLTYYVTTGSDGRNAPASGDEPSCNFIAITIPDSFQNQRCTVRYDAPGRWSESPGEPAAPRADQ